MDAAVVALLQDCEQISHNARMGRMVLLGKDSLIGSSSRDLITTLSDGSLYEQVLALQTCYGSRNVSQVLQCIKSPSRMLQRRAVHCLVNIGDDQAVLEVISSLPPYLQRHVLRHLRRRKRLDLINEILGRLRKSEDEKEQDTFKKLLWAASPKTLREILPGVFFELESDNLIRLLRRHAEAVFDVVQKELSSGKTVQPSFVKLINSLLQHTRARDHIGHLWDLILDVVKVLSDGTSLSELHLDDLVQRKPTDVAQLVIDKEVKDFVFQTRVLRKLSTTELLNLQRSTGNAVLADYDFPKLREEQRLAVYHLMSDLWRSTEGILPLSVINGLPLEERLREAHRHIRLPTFETRPQDRITYIALLPWEEAISLQEPFIRSNVAETRSSALSEQIRAANRQPEYLGKVLKLVDNRRHEQDPVRRTCLEALSEIRSSLWKAEHLDLAGRILRDSLDASDLSNASVCAILRMTTQILPYNSQWASEQLVRIVTERQRSFNSIELPCNPSIKVEDVMTDLSDALLPVLHKFRKPDKVELIVSIASALRKYLEYIPSLLETVEQILETTDSSYLASSILEILFDSQQQKLPELIPRLLSADPGWIAFSQVEEYMVKHKLNEYQGLEECGGRFGMVRLTIRNPWPHREPWKTTQLQQEKDLHRLSLIIGDRDRSVYEWQTCIRSLATLTYTDFGFLIGLTSDERLPVRDTAIGVLGRLDAGQGVPTLLEALKNDERVRVAIYAFRPALKHLSKDDALRILQGTSMTKVAVAKEVIRIAKDLNTESSHGFVRSMINKELHRDAFIALLEALASDIDRDETFDLFQQASQKAEPLIPLAVVARIPRAEICTEEQVPLRWIQLVVLLLKHPKAEVRAGALSRCKDSLTDKEKILIEPLLALLDSRLPEEPLSAASAVVKLYAHNDPPLVADIFKRFLKDFQVLSQLVGFYTTQGESFLALSLPTTQLILQMLAKAPLTSSLGLTVMLSALPWPELRTHMVMMVPKLHADALVKAEELMDQLVSRDKFDLDVIERDLASSTDAQVRRLGLSALNARAKQRGVWADGHRERLKIYQGDDSVLVAEAASFIFPPKLDA